MKIIVDMMGGDNAPLAVLEGAAQAVKEYGVQLIGVFICFVRSEVPRPPPSTTFRWTASSW